MDGVLIDSEPFWQEAEIAAFNSIDIPFTHEMCEENMGMRVDEVVQYWFKKLAINTSDVELITNRIVDGLIQRVQSKGKSFLGSKKSLSQLKEKGYRVALASSSPNKVIAATLDILKLKDFFELTHSAEFEESGKPHPAVYLSAANKLNVDPKDCIAIEDSYNGMLSALNAGMKVIVIPEPKSYEDEKFDKANLKLRTITELPEALEIFNLS